MSADSLLVVCTVIAYCFFKIPFSSAADSLALKSVKFYFYSPFSGEETALLDTPFLYEYDNSLPLKVLIHGWLVNRHHATIYPIRDAYLGSGTANVFAVDWNYGAKQNYLSARYLVEPIGKQIGKILKEFLVSRLLKPGSVQLIGHSLGAHIAGNVGKFFNGTIGRITGLDPAGPLFTETSDDALSSDNALFVDSIHTSSGVLGQERPIVDASFYPNRGDPPQPGCAYLDFFLLGICSHSRSSLFYAESIYKPYNFVSLKCDLDEINDDDKPCQSNRNGKAKIAYMGESLSWKTRGSYYLETNSASPYGKKRKYNL